MDTAKYQKRARSRECDLNGLAWLLGAGIEIERRIEYPDIVGARIVVDDPKPLAALERDMSGMEGLVVLRHGAHARRRRVRAATTGDDFFWQHGLGLAGQRTEEGDELGTLVRRQGERTRKILR